jgi:glycyl-tRNA synthetase
MADATSPRQALQPDVRDVHGAVQERGELATLRPGDGAGDLRQLQERLADQPGEGSVRDRPAGKVFRNEITPGNLIFAPRVRADGDGVLRRAGTTSEWHEYWLEQRWNWYSTSASRDRRTSAATSTRKKASPTTPSARWTSSTNPFRRDGPELEGSPTAPDYDLKQHAAFRREPDLLRPGRRPVLRPVRHRAGGGLGPDHARLPRGRLR